MRYSSKAQEKLYQPKRLRVLIDDYSTSGTGRYRTGYRVVIQDMATHEVIDQLLWKRYGTSVPRWDSELDPPGNWGGRKLTAEAPTKAEALKWAKIEATDLELPFDLQGDIVDRYDAIEGEVVHCLLCGKTWHGQHSYAVALRGWTVNDARVCEACRNLYEMGKSAEQDRQPYALHRGLTPWQMGLHDAPIVDVLDEAGKKRGWRYGDAPTPDEDLLRVILALTNSRVDSVTYSYDKDLQGSVYIEGQGSDKPYKVWLTAEQAEWIQRLVDLHAAHVRTAFLAGKEQGSSLVQMLARSEVHPDDFADLRKEAKNTKK